MSRITGLATGLDVDAVIEETMQAERTKIDAVGKQKALVELQQELYREVITEFRNFYDDYFDRRVEWIKKVGVKQNIVIGDDFLKALTLEKNFDYDDYSDSIYEAFHDNSNDLGDSTNNDVKCYLNEYRNSLVYTMKISYRILFNFY